MPSLLFSSLKPPEPHMKLWGRSGSANGARSTRKEGRPKHQAQTGWETAPLQREPLLCARAHQCGALRAGEHPCIAGEVKKKKKGFWRLKHHPEIPVVMWCLGTMWLRDIWSLLELARGVLPYTHRKSSAVSAAAPVAGQS